MKLELLLATVISACPLLREPVCGVDGQLYINPCWMEASKTLKSNDLIPINGQCVELNLSKADTFDSLKSPNERLTGWSARAKIPKFTILGFLLITLL